MKDKTFQNYIKEMLKKIKFIRKKIRERVVLDLIGELKKILRKKIRSDLETVEVKVGIRPLVA